MVSREVEHRIRKVLAPVDDRLLAAYIFGSVARGTDSSESDIDVGVLSSTEISATLGGLPLSLEGDLERALGRRVQVVVLNHAPADLVHRVLRDGRLLLDRDRAAWIRFEVDARNRYFVLLPTLELYRKQKAPSS